MSGAWLEARGPVAERGEQANMAAVAAAVGMPPHQRTDARAGFSGAGAQSAEAACNVLNLTLGPLDLNLLGLRVQLNQVNLRVTAIPSTLPGSGLLGDLLCGLTNLHNPTGVDADGRQPGCGTQQALGARTKAIT